MQSQGWILLLLDDACEDYHVGAIHVRERERETEMEVEVEVEMEIEWDAR